ncbi:MAG: SIS domain-containing protein [Myxococcota bacterium]
MSSSESRLALLRGAFESSAETKRATLASCEEALVAAADRVVGTFRHGRRLWAFGNGGSASDAQHLCAELAGRYVRERPALPATALTANTSDLTAIGNDYGFDQVFARLVEAHVGEGDVVIAISTSGNSPNVLAGVEAARARGASSIGLLGKGGGKLAPRVDVPVIVPSDVTARIQEVHITIAHALCELVDAELFPEAGA